MTHEGWTNYETWAVKLHMDNEQDAQEYWAEQARIEAEDADNDKRISVRHLAATLKDEHEEALPNLDGFAGDLLTAALGSVNWYEIAESLLESYAEVTA